MNALATIWAALGGAPDAIRGLRRTGSGDLPSAFGVSELAEATVAAAALAVAEFTGASDAWVDRRLASLWFGQAVRPLGWEMPGVWDAVAGDYRAADGWIRLHTNAPHHRAAVLRVLGIPAERTAVAGAVAHWQGDALETAVVEAGGCAAAMRDQPAWAAHEQGRAVAAEPLVDRAEGGVGNAPQWSVPADRPLAGVRVLDLTRVLAGPAATRFLAGFGAEVLRIDPPWWDEPALLPDMTVGKRCARVDLRREREVLERLLAGADVLVHGYRPGALEGLGLGTERRRALRPGLVEVSLDAWGWTGPWAGRRGFDSLVQMSSGIAEAGMRAAGRDRPTPLPVQALDHATGYLMAAAAVRGLAVRRRTGAGCVARCSLARTAALLMGLGPGSEAAIEAGAADWSSGREATAWGEAQRLRPPCGAAGARMRWDLPAGPLGTAPAAWALV